MKFGIPHIVYASILHYRKQAFYQLVIVAILASVITGSLLTGYSVRESLRRNISVKLGKSDVVISTGLRYFTPALAERLQKSSGLRSVSLASVNGICQNFSTGAKVLNARIFGVQDDFFDFHGYGNRKLEKGTAAVNQLIAARLGLKTGDDIIITFSGTSDIPASSPFAPSDGNSGQAVLKVAAIIPADSCGNFSLEISQSAPFNIFVNLNELFSDDSGSVKTNFILAENPGNISQEKIAESLKNSLTADDLGLSARYVERSAASELISSRVFLDADIIDQVLGTIPGAHPVITYLVNSISLKGRSTPYSFVAGIDEKSLSGIKPGNSVIINRWLADDIGATENDTIKLTWYNPGKISELEESSDNFIVSGITEMSWTGSDPMLMPEIPGISGSESCSEWDAGVDISMDRIRKKDEEYWNIYKGTPKAFISYAKGKEIWGNNFGPATAIRFDAPEKPEDLIAGLRGKIDPFKAGFSLRNIRSEMIQAAKESVDFSMLFLSLGFFIIVAAVVLMILAVKSWFDTRKNQLFTLFALGFRNKQLRQILLAETGIVAVAGALAGIAAGVLLNFVLVKALNSVWMGAVQTDTIRAFPGLMPVIPGFIATLAITFLVLYFLTNKYLKQLSSGKGQKAKSASRQYNLFILLSAGISVMVTLILYFSGENPSSSLSFVSGGLIFVFLMSLWRQVVLMQRRPGRSKGLNFISTSYYRYHPVRVLMPILLIAAGLFAVVITGVNRMHADKSSYDNKGGTGGYAIWAETTVPVKEDLSIKRGMSEYGLEEFAGKFEIVQGKRSNGDDASCLNLNHISSPPLLGIDPAGFIRNGSFSFASLIPEADRNNPWEIITRKGDGNVIYGVADQTVLDWGLKKKTGDTLFFRSESGELLKLVIAGGLKASVFQGYILTDLRWLSEFYPSISGNSVFLLDCEEVLQNDISELLRNRFESSGITVVPPAEKLEGFYEVTNTYLAVFTILGGFGIILGVAGLGFVLRFNYNLRRREFALMLATGFTESNIRKIIMSEQIFILSAGIFTGLSAGIISTLPSISSGGGIQWISLLLITIAIAITGIISLSVSLRSLRNIPLTAVLRRD